MEELLRKYPELRLQATVTGDTTIAGSLEFSAPGPGQQLISDRYEVSIGVPPTYPETAPPVRETASRISRDFHKLDTGHLCLGSPTRLRLILAETPSLLSFVERRVVPYLYGYSIVEAGGTLPFGELSHGSRGLRDDLAAMLGIDDERALLGFVRAAVVRVTASRYSLIATLHQRIRKLLVKIYPTKKPEDFKVQPRTLGIEFLDSGLEMDLVPLVVIDGPGDYGWQPSSRGDAPVKTSVTKQLEFIRARKNSYANFTALVRLLKFWRNFHDLDESFRSFTIELIVSHLQDVEGAPASLEAGLLRFFLYVADSQLKTPISFEECGTVKSFPKDRAVILDPCNADNNVARKITNQDCDLIVAKCRGAWETLSYARNYDGKVQTLELWKEVFGRSFVIED